MLVSNNNSVSAVTASISDCNSPRQLFVSRSFSSSRKFESFCEACVALPTSFINQTDSLLSLSDTVRARDALKYKKIKFLESFYAHGTSICLALRLAQFPMENKWVFYQWVNKNYYVVRKAGEHVVETHENHLSFY